MLHAVKFMIDQSYTQTQTRNAIKKLGELLDARFTPVDGYTVLASEFAKDAAGTMNEVDIAGVKHGRIVHTMKPKDVRLLKGDLKAFLTSEDFSKLPTKQAPKPKAAKVELAVFQQNIATMPFMEFAKFAELHGVKAVIDRGVISLTVPGMGGAKYLDAQTGEELAVGIKGADKKTEIDLRKAEGKMRFFAMLVSTGKRLTKSQWEQCNEFYIVGLEVSPEVDSVLKKILTSA